MHASNAFNADVLPFNLLDEDEYMLLQDSLDIGYYQTGEVIISTGDVPKGLYIETFAQRPYYYSPVT